MVRGDEVLLIVPAGRNALALPKGRVAPGEIPAETAAREVKEETGTSGDLVADLGTTEYWYTSGSRRIHKIVHFFLFRYREGDHHEHDSEVDETRWVPIAEATTLLSYRGEREVLLRAIDRLG